MCRIFAFRSILQSGVHKSLLDAENSMIHQSSRHPDGWGVAYYNMGSPHLIKIDQQAKDCKIFEKVSGVVSSNTVITHIRKSTIGPVGPLNTHPFQFGKWVFAHNGNVENFKEKRHELLENIDKDLRPFVLGETDSEVLFYLLLTQLKLAGSLEETPGQGIFYQILNQFLKVFTSIVGPLVESQGDYDKNYLTFVLTNGQIMYAFNGGQKLFYSTHKTSCSERSICPHLTSLCEQKSNNGDKVHHLLVSSEVINNENVWRSLDFQESIELDRNFVINKKRLKTKGP